MVKAEPYLLSAYIKGDKSVDETNAVLAAEGSKLTIQRGKKPGNALLDTSVGSLEPCTAEICMTFFGNRAYLLSARQRPHNGVGTETDLRYGTALGENLPHLQ